ncbi:aminotransferase class I/II-fold pyridoxal phosphate-dependent enzyme [Candidatus Methylocalor cossyra]|uniref:Aminotransferase n=1 Tax=Candidatus Methylocalor cossyra TaxID=3108543 RepID=A0ABM9NG06_9GAMM
MDSSDVPARAIAPFQVMEILSRAKAMERDGRDIVHLEIGEPDFPTPPLVVEAAVSFIRRGEVKYTPASGLPELRDALAEYYRERYGVGVGPERIFVTPGASGGFLLVLGMLLGPGSKVALADPGYPCYPNFVRLFGGEPCPVPVDDATGFHLNAESVRRLWGERMAGTIISSPANPTGATMAMPVMKELVDWVHERGGFVVSDEIYHGLEYGERSHTALEFSQRAFVVNSFSKYFGLTGWRLGWVIVPQDGVELAERLAQNLFISAPAASQIAGLASLREDNLQELERRRMALAARRDFLCERLERLGFVVRVKPQGALYVFADCSQLVPDGVAFARALLREAGVAVTPGTDFGCHETQHYVRFCYTAPILRLAEGMDRIERFLRRSPSRVGLV